MKSELCKTCIHTKVCMKDKNLLGDIFVTGNPFLFDNDDLYAKFKEREKAGFPCKDYLNADVVEVVRCKDCKHWDTSDIHSTQFPDNRRCRGTLGKIYTEPNFYCAYGERKDG